MSLFLPFEKNVLTLPQGDERWLCFNLAEPPASKWRPHLDIIQPWRPSFLTLRRAGFSSRAQLPDTPYLYDGGLLKLSKYKLLDQTRLNTLLKRVKPCAPIIVSGENNIGAQSFFKWVTQHSAVEAKYAKNHGIVFVLKARAEPLQLPLKGSGDQLRDYETQAGMFSHAKIDRGSALLAEYLAGGALAFGRVADLGAGWGFLSSAILHKNNTLEKLDLFEADFNAITAAERNLAAMDRTFPVNFFWLDITTEPIENGYDTIVTNPPFHQGKTADINLGQTFIERAAHLLKAKGRLYMVANRHLPYEKTLKRNFTHVTTLAEVDGFKVFLAVR